MIRSGIGFDIHRFAPGRRLVLGGVEIPHDQGLDGHSDADVLTHAVMDALLGSVAEGDIGQHFPNTDERWRGADSLRLLAHVVTVLHDCAARVLNVDATVIAEKPKLLPHIPTMRSRLAQVMGIAPEFVSVKATTAEMLGALGRREGIAAMAVASVEQS